MPVVLTNTLTVISYSSALRTSESDWFGSRLCYALLSVSALMAPTRQRMDYDVKAVGWVAVVQTVCFAL